MLHTHHNLRRFLLITLICTILAACNSASTPAVSDRPGISVGITSTNCPSSIIRIGDQVVWTNEDSVEHVVHAEAGGGSVLFDSGVLQQGDEFTFVFTQAGAYEYDCTQDGTLTGRITVEP